MIPPFTQRDVISWRDKMTFSVSWADGFVFSANRGDQFLGPKFSLWTRLERSATILS